MKKFILTVFLLLASASVACAAVDMANNAGVTQQTIHKYDPAGTLFLPVALPYQPPKK